ncbi:MAG: proline--tRNA ligase [Phycisphaerae bacterium]
MRYSKLLIPTVKEVPAEAEIPSHKLMIRAGFIRKVASGTYAYLPLGWRCLRKIMRIIREEMDAAGAQEILLPAVQPIELWQRTGRDVDYGETMCRFTDRHGRQNVLAPTAEEMVTSLAAAEISSYKQLPVNLYQMSFKFRDEFRPRFGVLRSREFIMKDAYSFNADAESLEQSYRRMYEAYERIFRRCGVPCVIVEAETGEMGGAESHQFTVPCESGEDVIVFTEDGSYAANLERAEVDALEPTAEARAAREQAPPPEEVHTPNVGTIEAVCEFLGTSPAEMIKTLIYVVGDETVVVLARGDHDLNDEKLTRAVQGRHIELAGAETIRRVTGAEVGFAGPQGLLERVDRIIIDHAVAAMGYGITGANKTDYHVRNLVPGRDFPLEGDKVTVMDIRNAVEGDTHDGKPLHFRRGIEVGQVFKLGDKYSKPLDATFLDENGAEKHCLMGCYGIGVNRIFASAIEVGHDDNGCILPPTIAPFEVEVLQLGGGEQVAETAGRIYDELSAAGVDVLLDDRDARPGVKFNDADLIGIPLRVVVGDRGLKEGNVEIKRRTDAEPTVVPVADAVAETRRMLDEMLSPLQG